MFPVERLRVGDKIKIVDEWPASGSAYQNIDGKMDKYLGSIMTIRKIGCSPWYCRVHEDDGMWVWYPGAIERVVHDEELIIGIEDLL